MAYLFWTGDALTTFLEGRRRLQLQGRVQSGETCVVCSESVSSSVVVCKSVFAFVVNQSTGRAYADS